MFDPFLLVSIPLFLLMISILVAAHELGHYLFARLFNMGVEEFAIGFGKKPLTTYMRKTYRVPLSADEAARVRRDKEAAEAPATTVAASAHLSLEGGQQTGFRSELVETEAGPQLEETTKFTIRPWPLGGFVRIKGMVPEEDGSEVRVPGGFYSKAPWQRFIVLLAGPVFSVLAGIFVLWGFFVASGPRVASDEPIVGSVSANGPAHVAGLQQGDRIVALNGQPVQSFFDMVVNVRDSGAKPISVVFERKGERRQVEVAPRLDEQPLPVLGPSGAPSGESRRQWRLGIAPSDVRQPLPAGPALVAAALVPVEVVKGLAGMVRRPAEIQHNVGGPVTMVSLTHQFAKQGVAPVFFFAALLSISVGIFNLLPIPPLDGGQMLMSIAEMLRGGRRLSIQVQGAIATAGFAVVMLMIVGILFVDIKRIATPRPQPQFVSGEEPPPEPAPTP
jgi:regulator of sigma E protease